MAKAQNILFLMADQLAPQTLPVYGHPLVKAPQLEALAERGVVFDNAYTNSPMCVPARAAMMTGQLGSSIGVYDSGSELPASIPTMGHYLALKGYDTCLSGKCHFIGPDQLHGFQHRLTTDICPSNFVWNGNWDEPDRILDWYHTLKNVVTSGIAERAVQQDHDEEAAQKAIRWLYYWARNPDRRPFFLYVSFSHPHDPYVTPQRYWDLYEHESIDMPAVPAIPPAERDPCGAWLYRHYDRSEYEVTAEHIRTARHAYYGNISLVDSLIGGILDTLRTIRELDDTAIIFCADHGDMLGERGLWYKMAPYERATRVPLIIAARDLAGGRRVSANVSLIDVMPTVLDLAGKRPGADPIEPLDGQSLMPHLGGDGEGWADTAISELFFEGLAEPALMLRKGRYKYIHCNRETALLFDIASDLHELHDLASDPQHSKALRELRAVVARRWNFDRLTESILLSQRRRNLIQRSVVGGRYPAWDFQPMEDATRLYYRGGGNWHEAEERDLLRFS
jgi:choline-sulfatase